jgi:hypothetical protein
LKLSLDDDLSIRNHPSSEQSPSMTSKERADLCALIRRRERLGKAALKERHAALNAEGESMLSAEFDAEDELWADVARAAQAEIARADAEIARRCEAVGVPAKFRPRLNLSWQSRGANADPRRRAELRGLMRARNDHALKAGENAYERWSVEQQEQVMRGGMGGDARAYLDDLPSVESLLPALTVAQVKALLPTGERTSAAARSDLLSYGRWSPPELPEEARP